jgi:hypothetical protein
MPLLRRHHAAPPDDSKTWSAFGTVHLRLPFLRTGRGARERRAVDAYIFRELLTEAGSNSAYPLAEAGPKAARCNGLEVSLISLKIHHKTTYHFNKSVALGPHRLMLRPRENRDETKEVL